MSWRSVAQRVAVATAPAVVVLLLSAALALAGVPCLGAALARGVASGLFGS